MLHLLFGQWNMIATLQNRFSSQTGQYTARLLQNAFFVRLDPSLLFAADNVDNKIILLAGIGSFHGMGMLAAILPGKRVNHGIQRQKRLT